MAFSDAVGAAIWLYCRVPDRCPISGVVVSTPRGRAPFRRRCTSRERWRRNGLADRRGALRACRCAARRVPDYQRAWVWLTCQWRSPEGVAGGAAGARPSLINRMCEHDGDRRRQRRSQEHRPSESHARRSAPQAHRRTRVVAAPLPVGPPPHSRDHAELGDDFAYVPFRRIQADQAQPHLSDSSGLPARLVEHLSAGGRVSGSPARLCPSWKPPLLP